MAVATALKALFLVLEVGITSLFVYVMHTDPVVANFPREISHSPWMVATLIDGFLIVFPVAIWISYKESNWILSALRIIPIFIFGSIVSCGYIVIQLVELSPEESVQDPIFHVLSSKKKGKRRSNGVLSVVSARILFITLGSLIAGTFVYTAITAGSPFHSSLTPWFTLTLVDCYIHVIIVSVWIAYKEQSWISAALWIVLLMCFTSAALYAYIVVQLFRLSPQDPVFLVFFNNRTRNEDEGSTEVLI